MKVNCVAFLLFFLSTQLLIASGTKAQNMAEVKITMALHDASLKTALNKIGDASGFKMVFPTDVAEKYHNISLDKATRTVAKTLELVLQNTDLDFRQMSQSIVLFEKQKDSSSKTNIPLFAASVLMPPDRDIHIHVTDSLGQPLSGASVIVKETNQGGTTDELGNIIFKGVNGNATLVISYVGYEAKEVHTGSNNFLGVVLKRSDNLLDQLQVIAYGTTTQRLATGNVSTVTAKEIEQQPVNNPLLALEGRVPGLYISQNSGVAGSSVNVQLRGMNSMSQGNKPLFIIDGVPYNTDLLNNNGFGILETGILAFSFINPDDIESISVLKDADATAIYGSRGANGVILITTKKGKEGATKVDINIAQGIGKVPKEVKLMNTPQYLEMRREAFKNDGVAPTAANAPDLLVWDTTRYTNWQKELIGGSSHYTDASASLSGGTMNTSYLLSGTYHRETTVFPGSFSDQKGSLFFNLNSASANGKFHVSFSGSYMSDNNQLPKTDITRSIYLPPNAPALLNTDGTLNWTSYTVSSIISGLYPSPILKRLYQLHTNNLVGGLKLSYNLLKGLDIITSMGYTNMTLSDISTTPIASLPPASRSAGGSSSFANNAFHSWIMEPQLTYNRYIGKGKLQALIGVSFQQQNSESLSQNASGYTSDALLQNIAAATTRIIASNVNTLYKYSAGFARLNYNLADKYIIDLNARRDGSSRFGPANRFHSFASAGVAWVFSKEDFIQNTLPFLSFGKLRASYGTTGNDQVGDYSFYDLFNAQKYTYGGVTGLTPVSLFNPNLAWEETKKAETGIDLGFLKDKILFNASYYYNRSSNQLLNYALPSITGFNSIAANLPATVQNNGWELQLNITNISNRNFSWSSSFNITIPKNKLVAFPNIASSTYNFIYIVGKPIISTRVFRFAGVNDTTGVYQFLTANGALTYAPASRTDKTDLINLAPKFYGGLRNSFTYKKFELDFLIQFTSITRPNPIFLSSIPGFSYNQFQAVYNRWQHSGDRAPFQQYSQSFSSTAERVYPSYLESSNYAYTDASFLRFKNLSFSYRLPENLLKKMRLSQCNIYLQGENLFTITPYKGLDPENASATVLPPLRVITAGVRLSL